MSRETFGVCGSGTMGIGIAYAAVAAGYRVVLYDLTDDVVNRAMQSLKGIAAKGVERGKITSAEADEMLANIATTTALEGMHGAVMVVEAIVENLSVKRDLFSALEAIVADDAILASNTSSLSITEIANGLHHPERVVGLHFFNPAHIMKLVEVIGGHLTTSDVLDRTMEICRRLGKTAVRAEDTPGFIVNRVARNFYGEAMRIVGEGGATVQQVDAAMRGVGFKMGPFELMDLIGIDINYAVTQSVYGQYYNEARFRPHLIQRKMVDAGRIGKKSGGGFYSEEATS